MEFKGTKGKWIVEENKYIIRKENNDWLCVLYHTNYINKKEVKYNAQLIAHAPEMLEMLNKCSEFLTKVQAPKTSAIYLSNEIEQLITKATTI